MKFLAVCHACKSRTAIFDISDDGIYVGECEQKHTISVVLQNYRYDLLFASACLALTDGYYREAVGSFAASFEEVQRIYVRVLLLTMLRAHYFAPENALTARQLAEAAG